MNETSNPSLFKRVITAVARRLWSQICVDETHLSSRDATMFTAYGGQFDDAYWTASATVRSKMEPWR